jgi:site-specific DNA-cytosine methylase
MQSQNKNDGVQLSTRYQQYCYAKQHLRGQPRPEVFPIIENDETADELQGQYTNTLTARYEGAQATGSYIVESELDAQAIHQLNNPTHSNDRADGISPTLNTMQGGNRQSFIRVTKDGFHSYRNDAKKSSIQGTHVTFGQGKVHCLNTNHKPMVLEGAAIRRLTPVECERLQGFPDGWTEYGANTKAREIIARRGHIGKRGEIVSKEYAHFKISDRQRYKCLGNAVSVPVVEAVVKRLLL